MKLRDVTFHDPGTDLSSDPKLRPAALHCHQVVGLHDAGLDALHVHGADGPQVDHLAQTGGWFSKNHRAKVVVSNKNVRLMLPRTQFPPWQGQQQHPNSDPRTGSD